MEERSTKRSGAWWLLLVIVVIIAAAWWTQSRLGEIAATDPETVEEGTTNTNDSVPATNEEYGEFADEVNALDEDADAIDFERDFDSDEISDTALGI